METQQSITEWSRQQFGHQSPLAIALRMNKEVSELLNALGNASEGIPPIATKEDWEILLQERKVLLDHAADEAADVGVMLLQVAEHLGIDLLERVTQKMAKNRARVWAKGSDGGFQHVESK